MTRSAALHRARALMPHFHPEWRLHFKLKADYGCRLVISQRSRNQRRRQEIKAWSGATWDEALSRMSRELEAA